MMVRCLIICGVMAPNSFIPKEPAADQALRDLSEQYPQCDPSAVQTMLALLRLGAELEDATDEHFARYKLSRGRFVVLIMLHVSPGGEMCCSDIAESVGVSRATMTGLLDGLERDGLIRRVDHPEDRRRITISLTANGRKLLDGILPDHFRRVANVMGSLGKEDRKKLVELLNKVRSALRVFSEPAN
jgi:DNA-binding MarR family transcriptional regulator